MCKKLPILILIIFCSACTKNQQKTACGTQVCTALFATVGVNFKDKSNISVNVSNYTVTNLRTNKVMTSAFAASADLVPGYRIVADDGNLMDLTTEGDNVSVSGTNPATAETKTVVFKIAGGCNCHVSKVSGPDTIVFDQ